MRGEISNFCFSFSILQEGIAENIPLYLLIHFSNLGSISSNSIPNNNPEIIFFINSSIFSVLLIPKTILAIPSIVITPYATVNPNG